MALDLHRIDLHMHTVVSDGTDTPSEILLNVKNAGIELFSVTDHDAVKGAAEIGAMLGADDPQFIAYVWVQEPSFSIWGSEVSAPLFSEIVTAIAPYMRLPDDRTRKCLYTDVCPTEEPEEDDYSYYWW